MFVQTWNKYLPIIRILLKRSVNAHQTLDMNKTDFQRAAGGRKVKYVFSIVLTKGRPGGIQITSPLAKDLISVLQQDDTTNKFIRQNELEFNMNNNFQLLIKNITPAKEPEPEIGEAVTATEEIRPDDDAPTVSE
ncbi:MAG TPA: hypothetical protein VET23_12815 [Chitinophagaceae bacterium]|nr:hypothetical protein [Chitinophagaceae bacterium]